MDSSDVSTLPTYEQSKDEEQKPTASLLRPGSMGKIKIYWFSYYVVHIWKIPQFSLDFYTYLLYPLLIEGANRETGNGLCNLLRCHSSMM